MNPQTKEEWVQVLRTERSGESVPQGSVTPVCVKHPNPSKVGVCVRCYKPEECEERKTAAGHVPVQGPQGGYPVLPKPLADLATVDTSYTRPRNLILERELTRIAALAGGHQSDYGLRATADSRAWPGGVRGDLDYDRETIEELADASSYLVWGIEAIYDSALRGDPVSLDLYERRMRALSKLIDVWKALLTEAA